jgi:Ca-activated chloride channel family protein
MSFIWPVMLLSLLLLPVLVQLYLRREQVRRRWAAHTGFGLLPAADSRRHVPFVFFLFGLIILLVSLARPQTTLSLPHVEGTAILVFDVSGSMAADDVKPTRLEAAKAAAIEFVRYQPRTVQIGLVAFSEAGLSVQPPTNDQAALIAAINRLSLARGTSLASGLFAALNVIAAQHANEPPSFYSNITPMPTATPAPVPPGSNRSTVVVLFTDGENTVNPDPLTAVQAAADRGIRVYPVGIGSPEGATLQVEGFLVHTQLDEAMLLDIAQRTAGKYYNAVSQADLREVYQAVQAQLYVRPEDTEVTAIFAGAGIAFLLIGGALSLWWFSRLP